MGGLKKKYNNEELRLKKYVVSCYLRFQMMDDISVDVKSHKLQKIAHKIIREVMTLDKQFQIVVIIDKLSPLWKNFKNTLNTKLMNSP